MSQLKSNIKVTNQNDHKDKQGLLAKGVLIANQVTEVFEASKYTVSAELFINITNDSDDPSDIIAWVTTELVPSKQDLLEASIPLDGKLTYVRGPVTISSGEKLFLAANTDDIVYRIYGYDNRRL